MKLSSNYLFISFSSSSSLRFAIYYRRIVSTNNERDNTLKNLLIKPVPHVQQILSIDIIPNRQTKRSISKKLFSSSQSLDSTEQNG